MDQYRLAVNQKEAGSMMKAEFHLLNLYYP